jgi:hypothetical protein
MAHTYEELKKMNVNQLREAAKAEGITGSSQMNKEKVLEVICTHLNIDMHIHHEIVGIDKAAVKSEIRKLKKDRDQFIQDKKKNDLKKVRKQIKKLKKKLRGAAV